MLPNTLYVLTFLLCEIKNFMNIKLTIQHGAKWHDEKHCDTIWYDTRRYHMMRYKTIQYTKKWNDMVWYNLIWYETVQYITMWYVACYNNYNTIWYGTLRYHMMQYDTIPYTMKWKERKNRILNQHWTVRWLHLKAPHVQLSHIVLFCFVFFSRCKPSIQNQEIVLQSFEPCPCPDINCIYTNITSRSDWWRSVWGLTSLQQQHTSISPAASWKWTPATCIPLQYYITFSGERRLFPLALNSPLPLSSHILMKIAKPFILWFHAGYHIVAYEILISGCIHEIRVWKSVQQNARQLAFCPVI